MDIGGRVRLPAGDLEAISALVAEHAWLIDHGRADRIAELYAADGRMLGVGPELVGRPAIAAWGGTRAAMRGRTSRHVCTNLRLVPVSDDEVRGTSVVAVYRHDGDGVGGTAPFMVGDYEDVFRREADGTWLFAERRIAVVFGGG